MSLAKVMKIKLSMLIADPNNANHMSDWDFQALVHNMSEHGFIQPILVQPDGDAYKIVDGHHRAKAASAVGLSEVLAVVWDGSEAMRKALAIGMNKIRGTLDLGEVARIVAELESAGWTPEKAALATGYTEAEVEDLLKASRTITDEDVLDGAPPLEKEEREETDTGKTYSLELTFQSANELQRVKRALKRAAQGGELGAGLLAVLAERD